MINSLPYTNKRVKNPELPPLEHFIVKILNKIYLTKSDCWVWLGAKNKEGYGVTGVDLPSGFIVHRLVYEFVNGSVPPDMVLGHTCELRLCCNPKHLKPMTEQENAQASWDKRRSDHYKCWKTEVQALLQKTSSMV